VRAEDAGMADKPVWEEEWRASLATEATEHLSAVFCGGDQFASVSGETNAHEHARAKLIAAAPAMARLLLKLEWVDTSDGEYRERCPACQCCTKLPPDGRVGIPFRVHPGEHSEDCELVAVLKAAGVR